MSDLPSPRGLSFGSNPAKDKPHGLPLCCLKLQAVITREGTLSGNLAPKLSGGLVPKL